MLTVQKHYLRSLGRFALLIAIIYLTYSGLESIIDYSRQTNSEEVSGLELFIGFSKITAVVITVSWITFRYLRAIVLDIKNYENRVVEIANEVLPHNSVLINIQSFIFKYVFASTIGACWVSVIVLISWSMIVETFFHFLPTRIYWPILVGTGFTCIGILVNITPARYALLSSVMVSIIIFAFFVKLLLFNDVSYADARFNIIVFISATISAVTLVIMSQR
jgi:hypothetical protein